MVFFTNWPTSSPSICALVRKDAAAADAGTASRSRLPGVAADVSLCSSAATTTSAVDSSAWFFEFLSLLELGSLISFISTTFTTAATATAATTAAVAAAVAVGVLEC